MLKGIDMVWKKDIECCNYWDMKVMCIYCGFKIY